MDLGFRGIRVSRVLGLQGSKGSRFRASWCRLLGFRVCRVLGCRDCGHRVLVKGHLGQCQARGSNLAARRFGFRVQGLWGVSGFCLTLFTYSLVVATP